MEHALDIRSLFRLQSITLATVRCVFNPDHYPLLALQQGGDILDIVEKHTEVERLIYGNEESFVIGPELARLLTALESNDDKYRDLLLSGISPHLHQHQ